MKNNRMFCALHWLKAFATGALKTMLRKLLDA
jgi:hypothetical protein